MRLPEGVAVVAMALRLAHPHAQRCREPHYRWTQKIDTSLAALPPAATSVTAILTTWAPPNLAARDRCAHRAGRELQVYELTGWIRLVDKVKDDGDWHVELTERADSPADSCLVAEIPLPRHSPRYDAARAALDSVIGDHRLSKGRALRRPIQVRIAGAAFFDGQHRRDGKRSDETDRAHGRCNSSVRALWEMHPVYRVTQPRP